MSVGIVSLELDLHAHAVAQKLREHYSIPAHVFAIDDYFDDGCIDFDIRGKSCITDYTGQLVALRDIDVVWWRRANQPQKPNEHLDPDVHEFISSEWKFAISSLWRSEFQGAWVNTPEADQRATAKTSQLRVAKMFGMQIPDTIISNNPEAVRSFFRRCSDGVVVKKLAGVAGKSLATVEIAEDQLRNDEIILCPSVYQQKIEAEAHLRVIALGDDVVSIIIYSELLDWRRDLNFRAENYQLDQVLKHSIRNFMDFFGLKMGVFDFILDKRGKLIFLEINPQGQFLFLEPLANVDLIGRCAAFFARVVQEQKSNGPRNQTE
jgi:glutathione synthase/RimK-type ligase-like ATP-grasp enzyme